MIEYFTYKFWVRQLNIILEQNTKILIISINKLFLFIFIFKWNLTYSKYINILRLSGPYSRPLSILFAYFYFLVREQSSAGLTDVGLPFHHQFSLLIPSLCFSVEIGIKWLQFKILIGFFKVN